MNYVYPKFSKRDLCVFRVGGAGLGNLLFTYSRALIFAEKHGFKFIWPTWLSLKIGPIIRNEKDKRFYNDLFENNSRYIDGIDKVVKLLFKNKVNEVDFDSSKYYEDIVFVFDKYFMDFECLKDSRQLIYNNLITNLKKKNKAALSYDFSQSINVHIRLGDFSQSTEAALVSGADNSRIPIEWYVETIKKVRTAACKNLKVNVFSDGTDEELKPVVALENVQRVTFGNSISDIIGLAQAKLMIASGSTFSMWARFLGGTSAIAFTSQLKCKGLCKNGGFETEIGINEEFDDNTIQKIVSLYN